MRRVEAIRGLFAVLAVISLLGLASPASSVVVEEIYPSFDNYWTGHAMLEKGKYSKHNADIMYGRDPNGDKFQGWIKIDMSEVPDNAVFLEASLVYYVVSQSNPPPAMRITYVADDPLTADPELLWNDITGGEVILPDTVTDRGWIERPFDSVGLKALQDALAQDWIGFGFYKADTSRGKGHAKGYEVGQFRPRIRVSYLSGDLAVEQILAPVGDLAARSSTVPRALLRNLGDFDQPFRVQMTIGAGESELYRQSLQVPGLEPGQSLEVAFPEWIADSIGGERTVTCSLDAEDDVNPANNFAVAQFNVIITHGEPPPPVVRWGWEEVRQVSLTPSGRPVKAGGLLLTDPATGILYAAKGNKTNEFFAYDPVRGSWRRLAAIPGKASGKGAKGVADGRGSVFLVKGNSTLEFWRYDIAANTWEAMPSVPAGNSGKKVTGGTGLVHVVQYGLNYIYLLKGPKLDFLRYMKEARAWEVLPDAPAGTTRQWKRGSWLVADGAGRLFAHRAEVNDMWSYDLATETWGSQLVGMPPFGSTLRTKKSKDGGAGAWREDSLFALKGSKSGEFWTYGIRTGSWAELETMPSVGTSLRKVLPAAGADFVSYPFGRMFFALKGNRSVEFWRYTMRPLEVKGSESGRPGVMAAGAVEPARLAVAPNPVTGRAVRLSYTLPTAGQVTVTLFDVSGRVARQQRTELARSGSLDLNLLGLTSGTYVLRLVGNGYGVTERLVITR